MSKELYLLVDGTHADPDDCDVGADNELRHENGVPVALREDGLPQTVAQGTIENMNVEAVKAGEKAADEAAEIIASDAAAVEDGLKAPNELRSEEKIKQPSDDDLLLKTDDLKPKPADGPKKVAAKPNQARAKKYKNREMKVR